MNYKHIFIILIFCLSYSNGIGQEKGDVLFTVEDEPVMADEFLRIFNKNREIVADENKKSVTDYLELYINYKLKLKQALALKYDTVSAYKKELSSYRSQLMEPYLSDHKVTNRLIREIYDRSLKEINASHILVKLLPNASENDSLKAYQKINEIRKRILNGENFEDISKLESEDPSAKENGGNLGYFTVFSMVYSFENAAYTTKVGEVSLPIRTQFGIHLVKVNDVREAEGEIEVAHIMVKHQLDDSTKAKIKIDEIHQSLLQNTAFELLAKQQSDDRNSAINGGLLPKFSRTRMIKEFADMAFSLKEVNDISKPFSTSQGWHIIKLIKKHPIGEFKNEKAAIAERIKKGERSKIAGNSLVQRLIKNYSANYNKTLVKLVNEGNAAKLKQAEDQIVLKIKDRKIPVKELLAFQKRTNSSNTKLTTAFMNAQVLAYYKDHLEETNQDFAFTFREYKEGLLLFDILQDKVWERAETDSVGLKAFYQENADRYQWGKRADLVIASCTNEEKARVVQQLLNRQKSIEDIKTEVNEGAIIHVLFTQGILEEGHKKLPENFSFVKTGVSEVFGKNKDFTILYIKKILAPEQQSFTYAKGAVINDYQDYLESEWIKELRKMYPVKVNNKNLNKLITQNQK